MGDLAVPKATPTRTWQAVRRRLVAALEQSDFALPGSVVVRNMRCGKPGCRCRAEPPKLHGPYISWTRSVGGKTVTRYLTEEQYERYRSSFEGARRLHDLLDELEAASLRVVESAEGWGGDPTAGQKKAPTGPPRARTRSEKR